jgi:tetratricopeptide (TPR) repeat protein
VNIQSKLLIGLLSILFILYAENIVHSQETKSVQKEQQAVNANLLTHKQIILEAQRDIDRSLTIMDRTISAIGVLVGLLTLIILVLGGLAAFFGIKEYRSWKIIREGYNKNVGESQKTIKDQTENIKSISKKLESEYNELSKKTNNIENALKTEYIKSIDEIKEKYENEFRDLSITEKPSGETKEKLDELTKKEEFLEGVGVELEAEDFLNRGLDYYYKNDYENALEAFGKATGLKPDFASAWINKGVALRNLGKPEEALKSYDKAIRLKPDFVSAWYNKGVVLVALEEYEKGIKSYDKAIKLKPDDAEAWSSRGVALSKLGQPEEAVKSYDKAIDLKPDYAVAWYNKACVYSLKGDKENSFENLRKAITLDIKLKEDAKKDEDFRNLWDDEGFKKIVE